MSPRSGEGAEMHGKEASVLSAVLHLLMVSPVFFCGRYSGVHQSGRRAGEHTRGGRWSLSGDE